VTKVRITQTRSLIGQTQKHRGTLRSLGLGRIGKTAEHALGPELEGKLRHVAHLVSVEQTGSKGKDE
jgi:large subunit ribosomal protein L30